MDNEHSYSIEDHVGVKGGDDNRKKKTGQARQSMISDRKKIQTRGLQKRLQASDVFEPIKKEKVSESGEEEDEDALDAVEEQRDEAEAMDHMDKDGKPKRNDAKPKIDANPDEDAETNNQDARDEKPSMIQDTAVDPNAITLVSLTLELHRAQAAIENHDEELVKIRQEAQRMVADKELERQHTEERCETAKNAATERKKLLDAKDLKIAELTQTLASMTLELDAMTKMADDSDALLDKYKAEMARRDTVCREAIASFDETGSDLADLHLKVKGKLAARQKPGSSSNADPSIASTLAQDGKNADTTNAN